MKQTYELNKRRIYALGLTADLKDENGKIHHFVDGYEYVEIGGIKWATMNIGAEKVTDNGLYFAWGETIGYKNTLNKRFSWECYEYGANLSKYNLVDGLTELESCDDAATVSMGKSWRMPTDYDFCTLLNATTHKWATNYQCSDINGILFTSNEDSSKVLFFPAAGFCDYGSVNFVGSYGNYWSSSLSTSNVINGWYLNFGSGSCYMYNSGRHYGFPVRAVFG